MCMLPYGKGKNVIFKGGVNTFSFNLLVILNVNIQLTFTQIFTQFVKQTGVLTARETVHQWPPVCILCADQNVPTAKFGTRTVREGRRADEESNYLAARDTH